MCFNSPRGTRLTAFSQSQAQLPNTVHLHSSSTLGTGRVTSHRERLDKLEDKEIRHALDGTTGKRKRTHDVFLVADADIDEDEDLEPNDSEHSSAARKPSHDVEIVDLTEVSGSGAVASTSATGSALRKNPDGTVVQPQVRPKSQKNKVLLLSHLKQPPLLTLHSQPSPAGRRRGHNLLYNRIQTPHLTVLIRPMIPLITKTKTRTQTTVLRKIPIQNQGSRMMMKPRAQQRRSHRRYQKRVLDSRTGQRSKSASRRATTPVQQKHLYRRYRLTPFRTRNGGSTIHLVH